MSSLNFSTLPPALLAAAIGIDDGRWTSMTLERGDKTPGGAIHVYAVPSRWQSIGCVTARLVEKKTRERLAPRAGRATATERILRYD